MFYACMLIASHWLPSIRLCRDPYLRSRQVGLRTVYQSQLCRPSPCAVRKATLYLPNHPLNKGGGARVIPPSLNFQPTLC